MDRRDFWKLSAGGLLAAAGGYGGAARAAALAQAPMGGAAALQGGSDLALLNARIWTMDPERPRAQAALVRNGRIVLVGSDADVRSRAQGLPRFDAGGRTVVPGFIDSHTHIDKACWLYAGLQIRVHSPEYKSLAQIFARLKAETTRRAPGQWIVGRGSFGFNELVEEKRFATRQELDAISEVHPIALQAGAHAIMFNTLGFKLTGLWDPKAAAEMRWRDGRRRVGTDVARDAAGVPTGLTTETYDLLPYDMHSKAEMREAVRTQVVPNFTAKGITSVVNMPSTPYDLPIDHALQAEGLLPMRLRTYYIIPQVFSLDSLIDIGLMPGVGNDMWRFGGVKHFVAGAGYDANLRPVSDLKFTQAELDASVWRSHEAGYQVLLHQAGESLPLTLNAVEKAQARERKDLRHRLEHYARLEDLEEIRRVKRLGMRVTITAPAVRGQRVREDRKYPRYATMIREGLEPILISDSTGTIPEFSPLLGIACVAAPQAEGGSTPAGEAPTFEQALAMWTIWAARGQHEEAHKGSISVGKLGDFAVLNGNPDDHPGGKLFDLGVDATILGGKVIHLA